VQLFQRRAAVIGQKPPAAFVAVVGRLEQADAPGARARGDVVSGAVEVIHEAEHWQVDEPFRRLVNGARQLPQDLGLLGIKHAPAAARSAAEALPVASASAASTRSTIAGFGITATPAAAAWRG
jgi:hypothetical protein